MTREGPQLDDAFGAALLTRLDGADPSIVMERDDGYVDVDTSDYFADVTEDPLWSARRTWDPSPRHVAVLGWVEPG